MSKEGDLRSSLINKSTKPKKNLRVTYNDNVESSHTLPTLGTHTHAITTNNNPLRSYDYCMVFPHEENDQNEINDISKVYLDHLTLVGIHWILVSSLNKKYIYILLRAKLHVLHQLAIDLEYQLQLDPKILQDIVEVGDVEDGILPIKIQHVPEESPLLPYQHIYGPYRRDPKIDPLVYWRPPNLDHPFRELVRMKLTKLLIETQLLVPAINSPDLAAAPQSISNSDGVISIRNAILNGHMVAFFPLHHDESREHLAKIWLSPFLLPWNYPMDEIRVTTHLSIHFL